MHTKATHSRATKTKVTKATRDRPMHTRATHNRATKHITADIKATRDRPTDTKATGMKSTHTKSTHTMNEQSSFRTTLLLPAKEDPFAPFSRDQIVRFLHTHLGEYRDDAVSIGACLDYALGTGPAEGGAILIAYAEQEGELEHEGEHKNKEDSESGKRVLGAVVINHTHMSGYIPEHILVYIAVHAGARGQGIGRLMMEEILRVLPGGIALHVEPDNPAVRLYQSMGFTSKYKEMRLEQNP